MCPYISNRKIGLKTNHKDKEDRRNKKWNVFYQNKMWKKLREWQITNFPLCHDCALEGRSVPATEVHHKIPFSRGETTEEKFALLLDPDNIVSLCSECHDKRHKLLNQSIQ